MCNILFTKRQSCFAEYGLLLIYISTISICIFTHEMWMDETHNFLLAKDSASLPELYANSRYEGHPLSWHFLIFTITHFSGNLITLQLFHLIIASVTGFLLLRYSPFPLLIKGLLVFGYYFIYEYSVFSRSYSFGILILFLCCLLFKRIDKNYLWICFLLFLLCNIHVYYAFVAIGLFSAIFVCKIKNTISVSGYYTGLVIVLMGLLFVFIQTQTPEDISIRFNYTDLLSFKRVLKCFCVLGKAFLPLQDISNHYSWNSFLIARFHPVVQLFLSMVLLVLPWFLYRGNLIALVYFYSGTFLFLAFIDLSQLAAARYYGIVFILFISAYWISFYSKNNPEASDFRQTKFQNSSTLVFCFILILNCMAGFYATITDIKEPFSDSKNAASFLQKSKLNEKLVVMDGFNAGPPISAYLNQKVFYSEINRQGSFCTWKKAYFPNPRPSFSTQLQSSYFLSSQKEFVLVSNREISKEENSILLKSYNVTPLAAFQKGLIKSEHYYIYFFRELQ